MSLSHRAAVDVSYSNSRSRKTSVIFVLSFLKSCEVLLVGSVYAETFMVGSASSGEPGFLTGKEKMCC